ncbi:hypothetical protein OPV22_008881 [Ensete ventricosum]|uniref:Uncharacterized protein n=1 Tax=Ensete ventricosum TaxID=4639 RepID=A0AAV8RFQ4_ENSVE|nr:hypothetical protein OPV22_008881 [Ensete ventricosum]
MLSNLQCTTLIDIGNYCVAAVPEQTLWWSEHLLSHASNKLLAANATQQAASKPNAETWEHCCSHPFWKTTGQASARACGTTTYQTPYPSLHKDAGQARCSHFGKSLLKKVNDKCDTSNLSPGRIQISARTV